MDPIDSCEILIPEGIRQTTSPDGAVLLDIEQGICFSLNPVGLKIWELLKQGQSIDKVAHDTDRDFIMSADEAKDYGIIDEILTTRELAAVPQAAGVA